MMKVVREQGKFKVGTLVTESIAKFYNLSVVRADLVDGNVLKVTKIDMQSFNKLVNAGYKIVIK